MAKVREQLSRLYVIGTYRDDEKPDLPDQLPDMRVIRLKRLDAVVITELSEAMLGEAGKQTQVIDLLQRETEGNAFFMVEVVRALAEEAGQLANIGRMPLPDHVSAGGVQQVIRRRLNRLPELIQTWLKPLAVAGRHLDLALVDKLSMAYFTQDLAQQVSGLPELDPISLSVLQSVIEPARSKFLTLCANAAVLEVVDGVWRFSHDKLRETLLADLSDEELPRLHRQVAEGIEAVYPDDERYNEALLEHWHQSGDVDKEIVYLNRVAEALIVISNNHKQARTLLERGLARLSNTDPRRISLLNQMAIALLMDSKNFDQARLLAEQALHLAEQNQDQKAVAESLRTLGGTARSLGNHKQADNYFQQSLAICRAIEDQAGIAACLNGFGASAFMRGHWEQAVSYFQQSLDILRTLGNQRGVVTMLVNLGSVSGASENLNEAQIYFEQALSASQALGIERGIAACLDNLGVVAKLQGRYDQARGYCQQASVIFQKIGDQHLIARTRKNQGDLALIEADYPQAAAYLVQSLTILRAVGDYTHSVHSISEVLAGFARLRLQREQLIPAAELAGLSQQLAKKYPTDVDFNELMALLQKALSPDDLTAALERGKTLDVDTVVQDLLAEFA